MTDNYEIDYQDLSNCCDAIKTESGYCSFCWEQAE